MLTDLTAAELDGVGIADRRQGSLDRRSADGLTERLLAETLKVQARGVRHGRVTMRMEIINALMAANLTSAAQVVMRMSAEVKA